MDVEEVGDVLVLVLVLVLVEVLVLALVLAQGLAEVRVQELEQGLPAQDVPLWIHMWVWVAEAMGALVQGSARARTQDLA